MRLIVRYISFILAILLLIQCEKEEPKVNITDNNFLNALIELGIDTDGDGQISNAEAEVVTSLDVSGYSISDMTGIGKFVNLDTLWCYNNQLTSLDVSNNTDLEKINLEVMPSLGEVCVWEIPFPPEGVEVDTTGSPNVYFTTDCSE